MLASQVDKLVFSSTCATYGVAAAMPITEDTPQAPISPYGRTKFLVERMLQDFDAAHGIRSVTLRYFNAAGADSDGELGERHEPETHLIPLAIKAALPGDYELMIFGNDFETPDGTCVRDYVHVADLADAHVRAAQHLFDGGASDVFNLGTGRGASVSSIIDAVMQITGSPVRYAVGPRRRGDPPIVVSTAEKALHRLGWSPNRSDIARIVARRRRS